MGFIFALSGMANAGLITIHGDLTTDAATNFITDTNTGRLYTRFDAFNLSVQDTYSAIEIGGTFEGWSIMTSTEADEFYAAALGVTTTPCDTNTNDLNCGTLVDWADGDFGASYSSAYDYFAYQTSAGSTDFSLAEIRNSGLIREKVGRGRSAMIDNFGITRWSHLPINLMLFKDTVDVPEPTTLAIFSLGIIGLASRRFKKKSNIFV